MGAKGGCSAVGGAVDREQSRFKCVGIGEWGCADALPWRPRERGQGMEGGRWGDG